jgi:uncharacterized protein
MKINIKDLISELTEFTFDVPAPEFNFSAQEAILTEEVHVEVKVEKMRKDILLRGNINTRLELECSRCLEKFLYPVNENFQTIFQPFSPRTTEEEVELVKEDLDVAFYKEDIIDLTEIVREQILLSIPMIAVCDESCLGLCPHCGQNLNQGKCLCVTETIDPAWHKLQDLVSKKP